MIIYRKALNNFPNIKSFMELSSKENIRKNCVEKELK